MTTTLAPSSSTPTTITTNTVFWAGLGLGLGGLGVVATSAFYAISPVAAALPIPNLSLADALSGLQTGRDTMLAAGRVGFPSDILMAGAALLLLIFRKPAGWPLERAGWALVTISVLVFTAVDALAAGVLTQLAALEGASATVAGFKYLFDMAFILGTLAFGLGAPAILLSEMQSTAPVLPKAILWLGLLSAAAALISAILYFANLSLPLVIGISIAVGALVFAIYGFQIARSARQA